MSDYIEKLCAEFPDRDASIRGIARQARIDGMLEAVKYLRSKDMPDAAAELGVMLSIECMKARKDLNARRARFDEEKPPAGHHAPAPEELESEVA